MKNDSESDEEKKESKRSRERERKCKRKQKREALNFFHRNHQTRNILRDKNPLICPKYKEFETIKGEDDFF